MTDYSQLSEDQLVLLVSSTGESAAYGALVTMHQQALLSFLTQFTHNQSVSEDLMQETFIKGYLKIKQYEGTAKFKTWLFSIGYREFLTHSRKTKRMNVILQSFHSLTDLLSKSKQTKINDVTVQMDVNKTLLKLSESERTVMILCNQLGMSHTEVAEILSMPLGTVKTHIKAARSSMQKYLGKPYDNEQ